MELSTASSSIYSPLDKNLREIRLFSLEPATGFDQPLKGSLSSYPVDQCPKFEALSYAWGDPKVFDYIELDGQTLGVSENLFVALRWLRKEDTPRILWIDAICIHQADAMERMHQVGIMAEIYAGADTVLAWLGPPLPGVEHLFAALDAAADDAAADFDEEAPDDEPEILTVCLSEPGILLNHLGEILNRPYWTRKWVVQEISLCKQEPLLVCGHQEILWPSMVTGIRALVVMIRLREGISRDGDDIILDLVKHLERIDRVREACKPPLLVNLLKAKVLDLIWETRMMDTRDPRDQIYSLLGLIRTTVMHSQAQHLLAADYCLSPQSVALLTTRFIIRLDRSLDVLRCMDPPDIRKPSWVLDFEALRVSVRRDKDRSPLVPPHWPYWTAGELRDEDLPAIDDEHVLKVKGKYIDSIALCINLSQLPRAPIIRPKNFVMFQQDIGPYIHTPSEPNASMDTSSPSQKCWTFDIGYKGPPVLPDRSAILQYLWSSRKFRSYLTLSEKRLIVSRQGVMGIVGFQCLPGDMIFVLRGLVPEAILREQDGDRKWIGTVENPFYPGLSSKLIRARERPQWPKASDRHRIPDCDLEDILLQ